LRHYERKGLLRPRRATNRYREYPEDAVDRVRLVRRALSIGFGLDDLARILKERDSGGAPCRQVRQLAAAKLCEIEQLVQELCAVRDDLRQALEDWDIRLDRAEAGQPARLLEALAAMPVRRLQIEGSMNQVEGSKRKVEGSKRKVESSKSQAEGSKLKVEGSRLGVGGSGQSALREAKFQNTRRKRRRK
jgi:DNA-binding transcriptional MerR regulator